MKCIDLYTARLYVVHDFWWLTLASTTIIRYDYTHTPSDPLKCPSFMCFCMTPNMLGIVFSLNSATNLACKYRVIQCWGLWCMDYLFISWGKECLDKVSTDVYQVVWRSSQNGIRQFILSSHSYTSYMHCKPSVATYNCFYIIMLIHIKHTVKHYTYIG